MQQNITTIEKNPSQSLFFYVVMYTINSLLIERGEIKSCNRLMQLKINSSPLTFPSTLGIIKTSKNFSYNLVAFENQKRRKKVKENEFKT